MTTRDIAQIALFAALTAALALFPPIPVPLVGVPVTAQALGPMLAGVMLGARRGGLALALFVLLVATGLPLLSGGRGGLAVFAGPTAGFLVSWPFVAFAIGVMIDRLPRGLGWTILATALGGIGLSYAIGLPWLAFITHVPLAKVAIGSAIFLPGDAAKVLVAALVGEAVQRAYPLRTARA